MKKITRIAAEIGIPPLIAACALIIREAIFHSSRLAVTDVPMLFGAVFAVALIPSAAHSVLMEIAFACGVDVRKTIALVMAASVGAFVACGFIAALGDNELWTRSVTDYLFFGGVGLCSAVAVLILIRKFDIHAPEIQSA